MLDVNMIIANNIQVDLVNIKNRSVTIVILGINTFEYVINKCFRSFKIFRVISVQTIDTFT